MLDGRQTGPEELVVGAAAAKGGAAEEEEEGRQPTGRVVGVVRRKWRQYCGVLVAEAASAPAEATRHLFVPADRRVPKIRIETRRAPALASQKLIVAIDGWSRASRYPNGHLVRALGPVGDRDTENEVLLLEHDVPHHSFPEVTSLLSIYLSIYLSFLSIYLKMSPLFCVSRAFEKVNPHRGG